MVFNEQQMLSGIDRLLKNGEGELSLEECDRLGTELPPGLYRYIQVTTESPRPKVLATIYLRTVGGELDEMVLARARKGMPPNPLDTVPGNSVFVPSMVEEVDMSHHTEKSQLLTSDWLPDAAGSQGVKGARPTVQVKVDCKPNGDHRWCFPNMKVRSTVLAPVLLKLREAGHRKVSVGMLQRAIEYHQTSADK